MIGVSTDRAKAQRRFADRLGIPHPMLSDPGGDVARAYGVRNLLGFAKRVTFLIDGEGRIHKVYAKVSPAGHAAEVLADLERLVGA